MYEFTQFLDSFFKLKPSLIRMADNDKFKIVIENFEGLLSQKEKEKARIHLGSEYKQDADLKQTEKAVEYLKELGCNVPVLFYTNLQMTQELSKKVMMMQRAYPMLSFVQNVQ